MLLRADRALLNCLAAGDACTPTPRCRLMARLARDQAAFSNDLNRSTLAYCLDTPA